MILISASLLSVLIEPLTTQFMFQAFVGGSLVAIICAVAGTWVIIRGMAFLGESLGHGMLPGVALATVLGFPVLLGAALSAATMAAILGALQRKGRLSYDSSIGLVFVGMLSLGIIVVSHSRSFATDATSMLFGDILAITPGDILVLCLALMLTVGIAVMFHRAFTAVAFDARIAQSLGLKPQRAQLMLVVLVSVAVIASFQAVGTLLVVGLLLAPVIAANRWTRRIPTTMAVAAVFGVAAVYGGLMVSWYWGTAAGASISMVAILLAGLSALAATVVLARNKRVAENSTAAASNLVCGAV